jgi:hypothetical protein
LAEIIIAALVPLTLLSSVPAQQNGVNAGIWRKKKGVMPLWTWHAVRAPFLEPVICVSEASYRHFSINLWKTIDLRIFVGADPSKMHDMEASCNIPASLYNLH